MIHNTSVSEYAERLAGIFNVRAKLWEQNSDELLEVAEIRFSLNPEAREIVVEYLGNLTDHTRPALERVRCQVGCKTWCAARSVRFDQNGVLRYKAINPIVHPIILEFYTSER